MSRLTIDLSETQHQSLKAMAALQGKTIRQFALEKLFPEDDELEGWTDDEKAAWKELGELLDARIESGQRSTRSFSQIVEETLAEVQDS